jgi:hypothetical protein
MPHHGPADGRKDREFILFITGLLRGNQHIPEILLCIKVFKGNNRPDKNFIAGDILILNNPDLGQFSLRFRDTGRVMGLGVLGRVVFGVFRDIPLQAGLFDGLGNPAPFPLQ